MNIVLLDRKTLGEAAALANLQQLGHCTFYESTKTDEVAERVKDAAVIITNKVMVNREAMLAATKLKLICIAATGTNNVDLQAAKELGIPVKNVSGYSTESVAQHTFAMLLAFQNKICYFDDHVKSGAYCKSDTFTHLQPIWELHGKRLGIIGLGTIGKRVAQIATCFGAEVVYYSTSGKNNGAPYQQLELSALLKTCDVVSIHAPLNDNTHNLLTYDLMKLMPAHAVLVNTGRGGIINETDLAQIIDEDLIGGACIDVYTTEPILADNPLLRVKNKHKLLLTPHVAWSSSEAINTVILKTIGNITSTTL
ncbi:D-2-hydroxyacid dehydrogenase [Pedobacter sp. UBA4863]|uniref:D-2-hydroxyacid dehydrogenase n=1 Tax=Pedobacter sp. UBA4863 TaxID=1947060 RepID=UPI0025E52B7C|nr:D-2-hydroxyacid dehydrogenase [Pedobacter sp. UBA4863]